MGDTISPLILLLLFTWHFHMDFIKLSSWWNAKMHFLFIFLCLPVSFQRNFRCSIISQGFRETVCSYVKYSNIMLNILLHFFISSFWIYIFLSCICQNTCLSNAETCLFPKVKGKKCCIFSSDSENVCQKNNNGE